MSKTTNNNGRLCNQIIRNLCVSEIAKKHDLLVSYSNYDKINNQLGIPLFVGKNKYNKNIILNLNNYFNILNLNTINVNLDSDKCYFQSKDIIDFLYKLLRSEYKNNIISKNIFKSRYKNNDDIFIHVRLGDVINKNPGIKYYVNAINRINNYNNIIISTDSPSHSIITQLLLFKNSRLLNEDEIITIQFGSTCKNIILSGGTFSSVIGYLGFESNIYYPDYEVIKEKNLLWHGDICIFNEWIPIKF